MTNFMADAGDATVSTHEKPKLREGSRQTASPSHDGGLSASDSRRCGVLGRRSHDHDRHGNIGGHGDE